MAKDSTSSSIQDVTPITPATYCFAQQYDDACHIMPFINLQRLQELRQQARAQAAGVIDLAHDVAWYTKRQCLSYTFPFEQNWALALKRLFAKQGAFFNYQQQIFADGVICAKMFTPNGTPYFEASFNPITNMVRENFTPQSGIRIEYLPREWRWLVIRNSFKALPIFIDDSGVFLYKSPSEQIQLTTIPYQSVNAEYPYLLHFDDLKKQERCSLVVNEEILTFLKIENDSRLIPMSNALGARQIFGYSYLPKDSEEKTYYSSSLFALILLSLGLDLQNNCITEAHPLWEVYQELQEDNPWKMASFTKENLLEYHLASLFKDDPSLKRLARLVVNFYFNGMHCYDELDTLYDSADPTNRQLLRDKKAKYLPNEELMLAYFFSQNLQTLWAAAKSTQAFTAKLTLSEVISAIIPSWMSGMQQECLNLAGVIPGFPTAAKFIRAAKAKHNGVSFLEVWQLLKVRLFEKIGYNRDLASFSGHGIVLSFAEDLMTLQNVHSSITDRNTMAELGFTIIDSYCGKAYAPFYQQVGAKVSGAWWLTQDGRQVVSSEQVARAEMAASTAAVASAKVATASSCGSAVIFGDTTPAARGCSGNLALLWLRDRVVAKASSLIDYIGGRAAITAEHGSSTVVSAAQLANKVD